MKKRLLQEVHVALGLKQRIIIFFTVIMLIPMGIIGYWAYARSISNYRSILANHVKLAEEALHVKFQSQLDQAVTFLHIGSDSRSQAFLSSTDSDAPAAAMTLESLFADIRKVEASSEDIYDIAIVGVNGQCVSERYGYFQLERDFMSYNFARATLTAPQQTIVHENPVVIHQNPAETDLITVTTGVFRTGANDLIGTIHVDILKDSLRHILDDVQWSPTSLVTIVNKQGHPVLHNSTGGFSDQSLRDILTQNVTGSTTMEIGQSDYLVVTDPLSLVPWQLVVGIPLDVLSPDYLIGNAILIAILLSFVIVLLANILFSTYLVRPIIGLKQLMKRAAEGDFDVVSYYKGKDEISDLYLSFDKMVRQIKELMASQLKEQETRKSGELRFLQAQVNPHFLYNTLDSVVRVAEAGKNEEVVDLIIALSRFYKSVLNISSDVISFATVLEHAENYLVIMKKRYRDLLDYTIQVDERVLYASFPKIIVQPIIENAIYHGIKNRKEGGLVRVDVQLNPQNMIEVTVADNGIGMTEETLCQLYESLSSMSSYDREPFGLRSVNDRIKLFFGKEYGLEITSHFQVGTTVKIVVPFIEMKDEAEHVSSTVG